MAKKTANRAYAAALQDVRRELARLRAALDEHVARQAADARNWGFVGDLTDLAMCLKELLPGPPGADMRRGQRFVLGPGDVVIVKRGDGE